MLTQVNRIIQDGTGNIYSCGHTRCTATSQNVTVPWHVIGTDSVNSSDVYSFSIETSFVCKVSGAGVTSGTGLWSKGFVNNGGQGETTDMGIDSLNNFYVVGTFQGALDLAATSPIQTLHLFSNYKAGYLGKFDSSGNMLFQQRMGDGNQENSPSGLKVDADGSIVLVGSFQFGLSLGGPTLTAQSYSQDMFVVRYNGTTGAWVSQYQVPFPQASIVKDPIRMGVSSNGIFICGRFWGKGVFGSQVIGQGISSGPDESFITRLKSNPGAPDDLSALWVTECYSVDKQSSLSAYDVVSNGNVVASTGTFSAQSQFGTKSLNASGALSFLVLESP